jgi:hypothetical protein
LRRISLALLVAVAGALAVPAASPAATNIAVGIADQSPVMFDQPAYQRLKLKKTRYFIRWNAIDNPGELAAADAFVARAKRAGVRPLIHISSDTLIRKQGKLPSLSQYRSKVVRGIVRRYHRQGVRDFGVWNEANHDTQPTYKNPRRAAQFFLELRKSCKRCTIVALDVLDQKGVESYIRRWYRALGKRKSLAKIVGIHNYSDTNRYRQKGRRKGAGTKAIIDTARRQNRRAQFWLTETGGVVKFASFKCSPSNPAAAERRAARAVGDMFTLAKTYRRYIKRLYVYNWTGTDCSAGVRFDAGLVRPDGSVRPGYNTFRSRLKGFKR